MLGGVTMSLAMNVQTISTDLGSVKSALVGTVLEKDVINMAKLDLSQ